MQLTISFFLLNPDEKMPGHITLRGPFKTSQAAHQNVLNLFASEISITGVGRFPPPQTTVYLACGSPAIEERWWKPDYGFNPHITVYDGPSQEFANRAYSTMKAERIFGRTTLSPIRIYVSSPRQNDLKLNLAIDLPKLSLHAGKKLDVQTIRELSDNERLTLLPRLVHHLKEAISAPE